MARRSTIGMSFLDVLCSAMGGVVVLAVIFSIVKKPVVIPKKGEFIFVEVSAKGAPELGIIVTPPNGESKAVLASDRNVLGASAPGGMSCYLGTSGVEPNQMTILYLEIRDPAIGNWKFLPYYADWNESEFKNSSNQNVNAFTTTDISDPRIWTLQGLWAVKGLVDVQEPSNTATSTRTVTLPTTGENSSRETKIKIGIEDF